MNEIELQNSGVNTLIYEVHDLIITTYDHRYVTNS